VTDREGQRPAQPERSTNPIERNRPRVWVGCWAAYNQGELHGEWIDADQEPDELQAAVDRMLACSPVTGAEEWGIFDHEGFGPLAIGEQESLELVSRLADGITVHGQPFAFWANHLDRAEWDDELERFEEAYRGTWESLEDYARELLEDSGYDLDALGPEELQPYIHFDLDRYAQDLTSEALWATQGADGVHIFERDG